MDCESCEHDLNEAQTEIGFLQQSVNDTFFFSKATSKGYPNHLLLSLFFGMALLGPNDNGFSHDSTSGQHIVMTSRWLVFCWFPSLDVMMNPSRYFFLDSSITQKVLEQFVFCWRSSDSSYVIPMAGGLFLLSKWGCFVGFEADDESDAAHVLRRGCHDPRHSCHVQSGAGFQDGGPRALEDSKPKPGAPMGNHHFSEMTTDSMQPW